MKTNNTKSNKMKTDPKSRRQALKQAAAGGLLTGAAVTSGQWIKPVVDVVILPAHASGTGVPCPDLVPQFTSETVSGFTCAVDIEILSSDAECPVIVTEILFTTPGMSDTVTLPLLPEVATAEAGPIIQWSGFSLDEFTCIPEDNISFTVIADCENGAEIETITLEFELTDFLLI